MLKVSKLSQQTQNFQHSFNTLSNTMASSTLVQSFAVFAEKQQITLIETLAGHYGFDVADAMQRLSISTEQPKKRGRPSKKAEIVQEANDGEDLVSELIQSSNNEQKKPARKGKMTPEEREAKKAETARRREEKKAAEKAAKAEERANAKAARQAEKEALKAAKQQEKEALKAQKKAEKEALKAQKKAEKEAAKAQKKAENSGDDDSSQKKRRGRKATPPENFDQDQQVWQDMTPKDRLAWKKANPIQKEEAASQEEAAPQIELEVETVNEESDVVEETETPSSPTTIVEENEEGDEDDDVAQVEEFEHQGKTYYRDDDNLVYDNLDEDEEPTPIGVWNTVTNVIDPVATEEDSDDEGEEED